MLAMGSVVRMQDGTDMAVLVVGRADGKAYQLMAPADFKEPEQVASLAGNLRKMADWLEDK